MVSHAMEDYIAAVWRLTQYGGVAATSEVARQLSVTAASTSYMFKKMAEAGLVEYKEYAGASLTQEGLRAAMSYIRRHRITERFLVEVLGISWDTADGISDQMEHSIPDEVVDRMHATMGYPDTCPHGYPIPSKHGVMPELRLRALTELAPGNEAVVAQVSEHDPKLLTYFWQHGIKPGARVRVIQRDAMAETFTIQIDPVIDAFVLATPIASLIAVEA